MIAMKFTPIGIENTQPGPKRREIPDAGCAGLYLVVQPSGRKSFAVRFRLGGKPKKLTLPKGVTLAEARAAAAAALVKVDRGDDPTAAKRREKLLAQNAAAKTLQAIAESYLEREGKKKEGRLRSLEYQRAILERLVYPALGGMPIAKIKRSVIIELLDRIEDGKLIDNKGRRIVGGPAMAQATLAVIRKVFGWYAVRDEDFRTPLVRGMSRITPKDRARSRILSDDELRAVWKTAAARADPFANLIRFLLLTSARKSEASSLMWEEVDGNGNWTLPAIRNKTKVDLVRPLSKAALAVIDAQPRIANCRFAFTYGAKPIGSYDVRKARLDKSCGVAGWTLHDLRRTARSLMSRASVSSDHAERCLGHVIGGVRGTYDRYEFLDEKRKAFEALAAQIERIVNPPEDNVVAIRNIV